MTLDEKFDQAVEQVKNLKSKPSNNELLEIYAYFKQATVGDNDTTRPGMLDMKGKAKWDSWTSKKGMSGEKAKEEYVTIVNALIESLGLN